MDAFPRHSKPKAVFDANRRAVGRCAILGRDACGQAMGAGVCGNVREQKRRVRHFAEGPVIGEELDFGDRHRVGHRNVSHQQQRETHQQVGSDFGDGFQADGGNWRLPDLNRHGMFGVIGLSPMIEHRGGKGVIAGVLGQPRNGMIGRLAQADTVREKLRMIECARRIVQFQADLP